MENPETDDTSACIVTLSSGVTMTFRLIPGCPQGFLMGSRGRSSDEEPIHRVLITEDFWLGETPVTQAQFDVWKQSSGVEHEHHFSGKPDHPAENLTWHQAEDFCRWLTETHRSQFPASIVAAELPCEARWEYACRAPLKISQPQSDYHTGDGEAALRQAGWYGEDWFKGTTHPVRQLARNAFGLYDMHGNVWEWCLDRWDAAAYRRRRDGITDRETYMLSEEFGDRELDGMEQLRVLRGGSFRGSAYWCRSASRIWDGAGVRFWSYGFRVCLVRSPFVSQTSRG